MQRDMCGMLIRTGMPIYLTARITVMPANRHHTGKHSNKQQQQQLWSCRYCSGAWGVRTIWGWTLATLFTAVAYHQQSWLMLLLLLAPVGCLLAMRIEISKQIMLLSNYVLKCFGSSLIYCRSEVQQRRWHLSVVRSSFAMTQGLGRLI